jgi:ATP-dependent helicase/nuclease subunit A
LIEAALAHWREEWRVDLHANPVEDWARNASVEASIRAIISAVTTTPKMTEPALKWPPVLEAALKIADAKEKFAEIRSAFLTLKDEPRVNQSRWAEKAGAQDYFQTVCAFIAAVLDALTNLEIYNYNRDALIAGTALLKKYEDLKTDQRAIDFADLEWRAFSLLTQSEHAETMQYRLDQRYRHILLDEFQDTNPIQWQCLTAWLTASVGADNRPTVFMVGDPKQAIYRFRRTDARLFQIAKKYFAEHFDASIFALNRTRRNAPAVVDFVNNIFADEPLFDGFAAHQTENANLQGDVTVLPKFVSIKPEAAPSEIELRDSLMTPLVDDEEDRYMLEAEALASAISSAVGQLNITESRDGKMIERVARYSDFMVLFRRRAPLAAFERALRNTRIPYVGARPGGLMAALEVSDMVALLIFLSSPNDDLALAQVLKSPLFNAGDDVLLSIRFCKMEGTWWQRLQMIKTVETESAATKLNAWLQAMESLPVHDLLDRVYHEADVLNAYSRAVPEMMRASVIANLNAFMALALEVDSGRFPSLTRFLNELKRFHALPDNEAPDVGAVLDDSVEETEIDSSINAIRLMTIHAAKGLESPIVWLIDADNVANRTDSHTVLSDWQPDDVAPRHFSFWATKALAGKDRAAILEVEANVDAREKLNLLYVAATRAKQYLVVSGTARKASLDAVSWHDRALSVNTTSEESWPLATERHTALNESRQTRVDAQPIKIAAWMLPIGTRAPLAASDSKREKGIEIHAALEAMALEKSAPRTVAKRPKLFSADITEAAKKILNATELQRFFNADHFVAAHNEIEIAIQVNGELFIQRIDRLVEFANEVWVLDYKTGEGNIELHRAQIVAYCDAVMPLYKNKTVHGAVLDLNGALHILR